MGRKAWRPRDDAFSEPFISGRSAENAPLSLQPNMPAAGTSDSCKDIKCHGSILITGGSFALNCAEDAVHSNADVSLHAGTFVISAGDDGIHGDGDVVTRADIMIFRCYGGIEVGSVSIEDSGIQINTSDDGINAAGGSPAGWDLGSAGSENVTALSGGSVQVTAGGDGFVSNGSIEISGGEMIVLIHSSADNEAMDLTETSQ